MNQTVITVVGNLVDEPQLRHLDSGIDVTNFRIASTSRRYDRESNTWVDAGTLFLRVTCWRALGSNVAASLRKGDPVVVTGRLQSRTFQREDHQQVRYELDATAVGPDLSRGIALFRRMRAADGTVGTSSEPAIADAAGKEVMSQVA